MLPWIALVIPPLLALAGRECAAQPACCWYPLDLSMPVVGPAGREMHAMVHLPGVGPVADVTVLFGGRDSNGDALEDTWRFDCQTQSWSEVILPPICGPLNGFRPCARYNHAMARSPNGSRIVLFGGTDGVNVYDDTWEFDPATNAWEFKSAVGPSPRFGHAMAYDVSQGRTVLFGGEDAGDTFLGDLWVYDGTDWTLLSCAEPTPTARTEHAMAYDAGLGRIILFGGTDLTGDLNDTWQLFLAGGALCTWTPCSSGVLTPSARSGHAMTYDPDRGRIILSGGSNPSSPIADTLMLMNCEWQEVICAFVAAPSARKDQALVYEASCGAALLFGGRSLSPFLPPGVLGDTWQLRCDPMIASQPASLVVRPGDDAVFTVTVTDFPEFQHEYDYRWRKNGQRLSNNPPKITGADTPALTLHDCRPEDNGAYDVEIMIIGLGGPPKISDPAALCVVPSAGDLNGDGVVDGEDIGPFVALLLIP
jgi:hypothetical protein